MVSVMNCDQSIQPKATLTKQEETHPISKPGICMDVPANVRSQCGLAIWTAASPIWLTTLYWRVRRQTSEINVAMLTWQPTHVMPEITGYNKNAIRLEMAYTRTAKRASCLDSMGSNIFCDCCCCCCCCCCD